jgi:hypothetical protein
VTATHTAGVYLLGAATLAASAWILPERLLPWLSIASGLLVLGGAARRSCGQRLESALHGHHHHDHDHDHHHTTTSTGRTHTPTCRPPT